jgi:hypothetical protein
MKPLSGREASVLALLAQSQSLSSEDKVRILSELNGQALKIAEVIIGKTNPLDRALVDAANGFTSWAKNLRPVGG